MAQAEPSWRSSQAAAHREVAAHVGNERSGVSKAQAKTTKLAAAASLHGEHGEPFFFCFFIYLFLVLTCLASL